MEQCNGDGLYIDHVFSPPTAVFTEDMVHAKIIDSKSALVIGSKAVQQVT